MMYGLARALTRSLLFGFGSASLLTIFCSNALNGGESEVVVSHHPKLMCF